MTKQVLSRAERICFLFCSYKKKRQGPQGLCLFERFFVTGASVLVKRKTFVFNSIRDVHEAISHRSAWSCATAGTRAGASAFAIRKFLAVYHDIGGIDLLAFLIGVAACLDSSGHQDAHSLTEITFRELARFVEGDDVNEVSGLFSAVIAASSAVHRKSVACNCHILNVIGSSPCIRGRY